MSSFDATSSSFFHPYTHPRRILTLPACNNTPNLNLEIIFTFPGSRDPLFSAAGESEREAMSAQQLTSGGRPPPSKERYVPLRERAQNKIVPLYNSNIFFYLSKKLTSHRYDRPEAQPYLMTVENLLERSTGTLQDSIWAPQNRVRQVSQQRHPVRQPSGPTQFQKPQNTTGPTKEASPAVQIRATESAPWSNSAWGTEAPKSSTVTQGNSSWEGQPSQSGESPSDRFQYDVC